MKKRFFLICFFFILAGFSYSQDSVNVEQSQQYETFSWQPVENVRKYQIVIEQLLENGSWKKILSKTTRSTSYKAKLLPGHYRMAVSSFNILGKKSATSEWIDFKIIDSAIPYLFDNYFKKTKEWKAPVLYINRKKEDISKLPEYKDFIHPDKDFDENTFFIKGKHVFSTDTHFYLVPESDTSKKAVSYPAFNEMREEIPLNVIERNERKGGVYVSYNPDKLSSGYYLLQARKNSHKSEIEILVLADEPLNLSPYGFEIDNRYKVSSIELDSSKNISFSVEGKGFTHSTSYYLQPTEGSIPYTYTSELERTEVPLGNYTKQTLNSNGKCRLSFSCPGDSLKSGYYNFVAKNSESDSARFLLLVKEALPKSSDEKIEKIISKYNKRTKQVDFTITSDNLTPDMKFTLISAFPQEGGHQLRIPLDFKNNGKRRKSTASIDADEVIFDDYMLMVETPTESFAKYFSIDNHYSLHAKKLSEKEIAKKFLAQENDMESFEVTLDTDEAGTVTYTDSKVEVYSRFPKLMPFLRFTAGVDSNLFGSDNTAALNLISDTSDYTTEYEAGTSEVHSDCRFQFDLLNFYWFVLGLNLKINPNLVGSTTDLDLAPEVTARFVVDERISYGWELFSPYIGLGLGYNFLDKNYNTPFYKFDHDMYAFAFAGLTLFKLYEMSYQVEFHNIQNLNNAYLKLFQFNFGIRIPIRRTYYEQEVLSRSATITKKGILMFSDFEGLNSDSVTQIYVKEGALAIGGMEGFKSVEEIELPASLTEIKENAFRNCISLRDVSVPNTNLKAIRKGAFENTKNITVFYVPACVQVIEKDAFKGWTNGQQIVLGITKDEADSRHYEGLEDVEAIINYKNESYRYSGNTPFEDSHNFSSFYGNIYKSDTFYNAKIQSYTLALSVKGLGRYENPMRRLDYIPSEISESSEELLNYFKSGRSLSFKVYGDGKKYLLYVRTKDDGVFVKEFTTKKNKIKDITIDYSELQRADCSEVRKFKLKDVTFVTLIPIYDGTLSDSYFYDFKVE
ncbi:MAG: leucine-rich repeat domain-containing protein [Treponema sp.]|nr:leucine-rich repeat domain-containing protein [Treponema sp.]